MYSTCSNQTQRRNLAGPFVDTLSFLPQEPVNIKTNRIDHRASQQVSLPEGLLHSILNTDRSIYNVSQMLCLLSQNRAVAFPFSQDRMEVLPVTYTGLCDLTFPPAPHSLSDLLSSPPRALSAPGAWSPCCSFSSHTHQAIHPEAASRDTHLAKLPTCTVCSNLTFSFSTPLAWYPN